MSDKAREVNAKDEYDAPSGDPLSSPSKMARR